MLRQFFSIQFQRLWVAGEDRSTWMCFRPYVTVWASVFCTVCFFKKTYPSHDHEFWTFVVDGSTVVVV